MRVGQPGVGNPGPLGGENHRHGFAVEHGHGALLIRRHQDKEAGGVALLRAGIAQLLQQGDLVVARQEAWVDQQDRPISRKQGLFNGRYGAPHQDLQVTPIAAIGRRGIGLQHDVPARPGSRGHGAHLLEQQGLKAEARDGKAPQNLFFGTQEMPRRDSE